MKLPSFFIIILLICQLTLDSQSTKTQTNFALISGMTLDLDKLELRFFTNTEKILSGKSSFELQSWAVKMNPFTALTISIGSLSNSGIWSRFNNPSPVQIAPLKNTYTVQSRLITELPVKDTTKKEPSTYIELNIENLRFAGFLSGDRTTFSTGFGLETKLKRDNIFFIWTLAWKIERLQSKQESSWFRNEIYFETDFFHALINELSLKTKNTNALLGTGLTQMPYGKTAFFIRLEHSLNLRYFLLNTHFFICSKEYLCQRGLFIATPIKFAINPQVDIPISSQTISSLRVGFSVNTKLYNGEKFTDQGKWLSSYNFSLDCKMTSLQFEALIGVEDILLSKRDYKKDTTLSNKIQFTLYPFYALNIERIWELQALYTKKLVDQNNMGTILITTNFSIWIPRTNLSASFSSEWDWTIAHKIENITITCFLDIQSTISLRFKDKKKKVLCDMGLSMTFTDSAPVKINSVFSIIVDL